MNSTTRRDFRVSCTTHRDSSSKVNDSNSKKDNIAPIDSVLNSTTHGRDNSIEDSTSHKPSTAHTGWCSKEEGNNSTTTHNTVSEKDSTTHKDNSTTIHTIYKEGSNSATHKDNNNNTTHTDGKVGNNSITSVTNTSSKKTNTKTGSGQANGAIVNKHLKGNNSS